MKIDSDNYFYPNVIVIGEQRSATTSLYDTLAEFRHEISLPIIKETHYFSRRFDYGNNWYRNLWEQNKYSHALKMEICPSYLNSMDALARLVYINRFMQRKICMICIVRNEKTQIDSLLKYRVKKGQLNTASIEALIHSDLAHELASKGSIQSWKYYFPQLIQVKYEDLISNNICQFIDSLSKYYHADLSTHSFIRTKKLLHKNINPKFKLPRLLKPIRPLALRLSEPICRYSPKLFAKLFN